MTESKTWIRDEALAHFDALLQAAKLAPQFISTSGGHFMITFKRDDRSNPNDIFSTPGPLSENDIDIDFR